MFRKNSPTHLYLLLQSGGGGRGSLLSEGESNISPPLSAIIGVILVVMVVLVVVVVLGIGVSIIWGVEGMSEVVKMLTRWLQGCWVDWNNSLGLGMGCFHMLLQV